MKAALLRGKLDLAVEDVPVPTIGPDDILLKVRAASICGTDVRMYKNGRANVSPEHPLIIGHEFAGTIEMAGSEVVGFEPGQRVSVAPNFGCGTCDLCISGQTNACSDFDAFGITIPGAFAEYVRIPAAAIRQGNLMTIREGASFEEAALIEPLSCVYNGQRRIAMEPGSDVLVIGAGPIGIMHVMMAKLLGAGRVFVNDLSRERLEQVVRIVPDAIAIEGDVSEGLAEHGAPGVDVCIIAAPAPVAQTQSLAYMKMNGKLLFFGGLPKDRENVSLNTNLVHYRQLAIFGCTGQSLTDYRTCAKLVADGRIPVGEVITGRFPLDEFEVALDVACAAKGLKNVIVFE